MPVQDGKRSNNRFERKFVIPRISKFQVEKFIKTHPGVFSEIFHERQVNNIYFDTPNLDFFAARGEMGLMNPVNPGFIPGSDEAIVCIFGNELIRM